MIFRTNRDEIVLSSNNLKTVCLYGHEGSNPPSSAKARKHSRKWMLFLFCERIYNGIRTQWKNGTVCCFLNGDRRFLRNITLNSIQNVEQKSRTKSPILRQSEKAFTKVDAFFVLREDIQWDSNAVKKRHSVLFFERWQKIFAKHYIKFNPKCWAKIKNAIPQTPQKKHRKHNVFNAFCFIFWVFLSTRPL